MSASETEELDTIDATEIDAAEGANPEDEQAPQPLNLDVQVASPSACERHVTVTISREDIDRYFDEAFGELMPNGRRAGLPDRPGAAQARRAALSREVADRSRARC